MAEPIIVGGRHQDIGAQATELQDALSAGVRSFDFRCVDFDWNAPIDLDVIVPGGDSFSLEGRPGSFKTVLHRTYTQPEPMLSSRSAWWTGWAMRGLSWQNDRTNAAPLVSLAYTDRWLIDNVGFYGSLDRGLELGVGGTLEVNGRPCPGVASEFIVTNRSEFHRCKAEGFYAFGARNFTIDGRTSFERNLGTDAVIDADPGARCGHGTIMDVAFERDDAVTSLRLTGLRGMHVGANRHMLGGLNAMCDDSCWYPNVVYGDMPMRRQGLSNRWIGRRQQLTGSRWSGYQIVDEPESTFDLRLALDGSGT